MKGSKWGPIGGISILGCMVPNTCGQDQGRIKGVKGAKGREGEWREQIWSKGSEQGVKGSESICILGFRVPTIMWQKKL